MIQSTNISTAGIEAKVASLISKSKETSVSHSDLMELVELIEELEKREEFSGFMKRFQPGTPYSVEHLPKHKACMDGTAKYREMLLLGANRSGKTELGAVICAILATGQYPEWYDGVMFDGPVDIWAVGKTGQTTRDTVQRALMGPPGAEGTGMIPKDCIGKKTALQGTPGAYDTVQVLHKSGKWSTISFKSYKQEVHSFFGTKRHFVWLDEPAPELIYNECLLRTAKIDNNPINGREGGRLLHTITPKEGLTRLLADYLANCDLLAGTERVEGIEKAVALMEMEDGVEPLSKTEKFEKQARGKHRGCVGISWDDIPWLDETTKLELLESTPPQLREVVSRGIPALGDGAVYPLPLKDILLRPNETFQIPAYYKKVYGMDVGWNRTAAVFGAIDPDSGILYIYDVHYVEHQPPEVHAARIKQIAGNWMVGAIDPASKLSSVDGDTALRKYRQLGLRLIEADNAVETGIATVTSMMVQGRLKFFPHTTGKLQNEYILYRREEGKIVKKDDHAMDALRYLVMSMKHAQSTPAGSTGIPGLGQTTKSGRRYNV